MSHELSIAELDAETGAFLPAREALARFDLSVFTLKVASVHATNVAVALGGGFGSVTGAEADQTIWVVQQ